MGHYGLGAQIEDEHSPYVTCLISSPIQKAGLMQ